MYLALKASSPDLGVVGLLAGKAGIVHRALDKKDFAVITEICGHASKEVRDACGVNAMDEAAGRLPLEKALACGEPDVVRQLFASGADPWKPNKKGFSAAYLAFDGKKDIHKGSLEVFREKDDASMLYLAVKKGDHKLLRCVLRHEEFASEVKSAANAPLLAALHDPKATEILIAAGAPINAVDDKGRKPLHYAVEGGGC